jgi:hypothetical protein
MLTTDALNISSLSWFEAGFRQQTPVGLPPSLSELIAQAQLSSLMASLLPLRHTVPCPDTMWRRCE